MNIEFAEQYLRVNEFRGSFAYTTQYLGSFIPTLQIEIRVGDAQNGVDIAWIGFDDARIELYSSIVLTRLVDRPSTRDTDRRQQYISPVLQAGVRYTRQSSSYQEPCVGP